ncbi:hypothetical protein MSG28_003821 [Choristoneura fumiferana]|uniref:Uncharacterized protein n=2 Tax=Choristoneura fumiferana TaxID=7141 RepID=A0ACC0KGF3_CHOFU|nr:hypothetical protein MSG28_003818 [Choristoneura fumiferana]KAI8435525.1 hypothetical protein MSG28_003821 [Choristoneura fumiferana]
MFTISAYSVHPLVARFLTLWRYVEVVTDWVTFFLSCLCCQCLNNMPCDAVPPSEGSKSSIETPQILSRAAEVDSGRVCGEPFRPQHLVIDFHRQPGDNEGVEQKCNDFWNFVRKQPAMGGMLVTPESNNKTIVKKVPEQHKVKNDMQVDEYPAVHMLKKLDQLSQSIEAFAASEQTA